MVTADLEHGYTFLKVFRDHSRYIFLITFFYSLLVISLFVALKLLCDPENVPAMVNCRAGKDRTGIVIALVLWCIGWSKDDIVADYAQSQVCWFFTWLTTLVFYLTFSTVWWCTIWHGATTGRELDQLVVLISSNSTVTQQLWGVVHTMCLCSQSTSS